MDSRPRVALVVSHPIQHFCPQYESFARYPGAVFKVFFASMLGYQKYFDADFKKEISWGNISLDKFDHTFLNESAVLPADAGLDAPNIGDRLLEFSPHVVIVYGYYQKLQRRAYRWAIKHDVRIAYISDAEEHQKRNIFKQALKYFFVRRHFSRISYFLSVGHANASFYRKHGVDAGKLIEMHFPIDISQYRRSYEERVTLRSMIRRQYGLNDSDNVLIVVGKLSSWKNQDHIIEAMGMLEDQNVLTHLFIVGSGQMQETWEKKATALKSSKVHFTGFVKIEDLPGYYAASDIYVHPASIEPHSIAVSEAIYMGCPVVISDRCGSYGAGDDVEHDVNGFVYPFNAIGALAERIRILIENPALREKFSRASHDRAVFYQRRSHEEAIAELASRVAMNKN
jgi:glycosyltransferase involved in cell wall biosynthesis